MNQIEKKTPVHSGASINPVRRCRRQIRAALLALVGAGALLAALGAAPAMAATCNKPERTWPCEALRDPHELGDQPGRDPGDAGRIASLGDGYRREVQHGPAPGTHRRRETRQQRQGRRRDAPPGLVGNPNALPRCTAEELANGGLIGWLRAGMPLTSQVGDLTVFLNTGSFTRAAVQHRAPAGEPAQFGANILLANSFLDVSVVTRLRATPADDSSNVSGLLPLVEIKRDALGRPGGPSHDADRACPAGAPLLEQWADEPSPDAADFVHGSVELDADG